MKTESLNTTLVVSDLEELSAADAGDLRTKVRGALEPSHTTLDVNLSKTRFIDSSGLGALIALHKTMCTRGGRIRLVNPAPSVQQILELTRLHQVMEIVKL